MPVLGLLVEFIIGDFGGWGGELHGADFVVDLAAEGISEVKEAGGGHGGEVAFGEFGFDEFEFLAEVLEACSA